MWIVLYPDSSYVEPMAAASATFTIPKGSIQDADSPLEPFSRDTHGTKWTSTTVRDTTTFGYTYPETQTNNRADTISQINKLYGAGFQKSGGLGSTIHRRGDTTTTTTNNNNNTNEEKNVYAANPATTTTTITSDNDDANAQAHGFEIQGRQRRYSADLISNKHALVDGSYAIYLFVGDFDKENPRGWALERNLAGTHVAFSRMGNNETNGSGSGSGSGDGNEGHSAVVTGGRVPLTNILREKVRRGELESLEEESVERYLRGNLHWRAAKFDDTPIPLEDISDLSIIVSMAEVTPTSHENELPTRENFKKLARITQGRKGGC